jgi:cyanate permease
LILPLGLLLRGSEPAREAAAALPDVPYPPAIRRSRRLRVRVPTADAARLLLVFAAPPLVMTAIVFHAVSLLGLRGISAPQAAAALSVFGLANAAGTLAAGAVADRLSTRALLSAMSGVLLAGALVVLAPDAVTSYAGFALVGFSGGVFGVASGITWARTYGLAAIGSLQGMSVAAQIAAAAAGPLPLAFSLQLSGSYVPGLVLLVAVGAVALAGALGWREPQSRSATV